MQLRPDRGEGVAPTSSIDVAQRRPYACDSSRGTSNEPIRQAERGPDAPSRASAGYVSFVSVRDVNGRRVGSAVLEASLVAAVSVNPSGRDRRNEALDVGPVLAARWRISLAA